MNETRKDPGFTSVSLISEEKVGAMQEEGEPEHNSFNHQWDASTGRGPWMPPPNPSGLAFSSTVTKTQESRAWRDSAQRP